MATFRNNGYPPKTIMTQPTSIAIDRSLGSIVGLAIGDGRYKSPNQYVEWDANGKITGHGMLQQQIPTFAPSSEDESSSSNDPEEDGKGATWLIALGIILFVAAAALFLWLKRSRTKPATKEDHPEELRKLLNDLDRLVEASEEDSTALSISRFKRLLIKAVHEADFDEDLAEELDKIALVHIPNYTKSFLSAIKLGRDDDLETKLRETIDMMSTKIEEIVEEQRSRYRDGFNVQDGFVKARHSS